MHGGRCQQTRSLLWRQRKEPRAEHAKRFDDSEVFGGQLDAPLYWFEALYFLDFPLYFRWLGVSQHNAHFVGAPLNAS